MGLDPDDDSFPAGDGCTVCEDELFKGTTPDCILAVVQDIVRCPGTPEIVPGPPNGSFYLPQTGPCVWAKLLPNYTELRWELRPTDSLFTISWPSYFWFFAIVDEVCHDAFANTLECNGPPAAGEGGYVTCWWGPWICKPPCT